MSELDMSDMGASSASLKPAVFHILLALASHESHGYAIMQTVREQSGGRVKLQTGSLYRHLAMLIDQGLVAEGPAPRQVEDARRGTHYRLTPRGRQALEQERRYLAGVMEMLGGLRANWRKESL
jgi:DNA-binding PadR family transcriptional regulator